MSKEKRFSVGRGIEGCLVSVLCTAVPVLLIGLLVPLLHRSELLKEMFNKTVPVAGLVWWLFVICLGGYVAARRGKTTGWTNSLVVGLLAEWYMAARLFKGTTLLEMMDDAGLNWRRLMALALTIPVAVVGGILWENSCKRPSGHIRDIGEFEEMG